LSGVMTLQRRLSGMERDLAAIQAKVYYCISSFLKKKFCNIETNLEYHQYIKKNI